MGSFAMALVWYFQNGLGWTISSRFCQIVACIFFLWGVFGAWRDQKRQVNEAADVIRDLNEKLSEKTKRGAIHQALVKFIFMGRQMMNDFQATARDYVHEQIGIVNSWQDEVEHFLHIEVGPYAAMEFNKPTGNGGGMLRDEFYIARLKSSKMPEQLEVLDRIISNPQAFITPK